MRLIHRAALALALLAAPLARAQDAAPLAPPPLAPPAADEIPSASAPVADAIEPAALAPPPLAPAPLAPPVAPPSVALAPTASPAPPVATATASVPALGVPVATPPTATLTAPATVVAVEAPPPAAESWPPDRVDEIRFVLGVVGSAIAWGGGVVARADIGLFSIGDWSAIALGIDLLAVASWLPYSNSGLIGVQPIVDVAVAWRFRIDRVELAPRGGIALAFPYETLASSGDWRVGFAIRALVGAQAYWRLAPALQLFTGLDVQFAAGELVTLTVGVRL